MDEYTHVHRRDKAEGATSLEGRMKSGRVRWKWQSAIKMWR